MSQIEFLDTKITFDEDHSGGKQNTLIIGHHQEIPDSFVADLKRDKIDTLHTPEGEFMRVATIPVVIVEKWQREGFDIHKAPIKEILQRLQKEEFDAFITTRKRVY